MIRIIIADDHTIVRRGLCQIVADEPGMEVAGEAANGQELLDLLREQTADVVVLDITMPVMNGLNALKELKQNFPALPVLVLTVHGEEQFGLRAFRAGAAGFLSKESTPTELVKAIRAVVKGGTYASLSLAERLTDELGILNDLPPHQHLSDREYEVLQLLGSGKTVSQIAANLTLSVKTISTYRVRILEKMRLHNNAELIEYVIRNRLAG